MRLVSFILIILTLSSCRSRQKAQQSVGNKSITSEQKKVSKNDKKGTIKKYEQELGVKISKRSEQLYQFVDNWIGTPYCYGGANKKCTDCSGFTCNLYDVVFNYKIPRSADAQMEKARRVKERKLKEGDLVFFSTEKGKKKASHVGVYLGNKKFVHASTSKGVRIDNLNDKYYERTFLMGGRLK